MHKLDMVNFMLVRLIKYMRANITSYLYILSGDIESIMVLSIYFWVTIPASLRYLANG